MDICKQSKTTLDRLDIAKKLGQPSSRHIDNLADIVKNYVTDMNCEDFINYLTGKKLVKVIQKFIKIDNISMSLRNEADSLERVYFNLVYVLGLLCHLSEKFCKDVYNSELQADLLTLLESPLLSPQKLTEKNQYIVVKYTVRCTLKILFLLAIDYPDSRKDMRNVRAVEILQKYKKSSARDISVLSVMVQVNIINDDDKKTNVQLQLEDFRLLISWIECYVNTGVGPPEIYFFDILKFIKTINKLTIIDENKKRFVEAGGLQCYVRLIKKNMIWDVVVEVTRGLRMLGFKCKNDIIKETDCVKTNHEDYNVKRIAEGVPWNLGLHEKKEVAYENLPTTRATATKSSTTSKDATAEDGGHIFISYQWDSKATVLKIRERLREAGFKTWLDEDDMSGSVLEAMALAVEGAHTVIICISQKYKDSQNCKLEAEYTYQRKKNLIPLRLQAGYCPDGWLGLLVGSKFVYDVSQQTRFEESVDKLIEHLSQGRKMCCPSAPAVRIVARDKNWMKIGGEEN